MNDEAGSLILNLTNVYGERINATTDVILEHRTLSDRRVARNIDASKRIKIPNLHSNPQGLYRLEIDPLGYMPLSQFVNIESGEPTSLDITCAVDPRKVTKVEFPAYDDLSETCSSSLANQRDSSGIREQVWT